MWHCLIGIIVGKNLNGGGKKRNLIFFEACCFFFKRKRCDCLMVIRYFWGELRRKKIE